MFQLKVTIEVVNDKGNLVDYKGYFTTADGTGARRPIQTQQVIAKGMTMEDAHLMCNRMFNATNAIKELING